MNDTFVNNTKQLQLFGFMNKLFTNQIQMNQYINSMSLSTTDPGQNEIIKKVAISNNENFSVMNEMSQFLQQEFLQVSPPVSRTMIENRNRKDKRWGLFRKFLKKNSKKYQDYPGWFLDNKDMLTVEVVNGQELLYYKGQELQLFHVGNDNAITTTHSSTVVGNDNAITTTHSSTMMNTMDRPVGGPGVIGSPLPVHRDRGLPLSVSAMNHPHLVSTMNHFDDAFDSRYPRGSN